MHPLIFLILIASFGYLCSIIQHYSITPAPLTITLFVLIVTILLTIIL
jgi:hypothetical protein